MSETVQKQPTKQALKPPSMYNVVFFNDDFTTVEFVIACSMLVFGKTAEQGEQIAQKVHTEGRAIVAQYVKDIALTKKEEAIKMARKYEFPFKTDIEANE